MVPSGVSLTLARKTQDGFGRCLGGRTDLPGSDAVQGRRGRHRLPHLGKEGHRVLVADTVRDDRPVERLLLAEHRRPTLVLAPRAHDRHERLLVLPDPATHFRVAADLSQSGLSPKRCGEDPPPPTGKRLAPGGSRRYWLAAA